MKTLTSIALSVFTVFATSAFAFNRPPVIPVIPVVPVFPVRPILPIHPIVPQDSRDVGAVSYEGAGFRTESVEFENELVTHVRLRIPNQCALQINPIVFRGERGRVPANLVTTYNDGLYSHFIYGVNGGLGAALNEVEMGLNSLFYYGPEHRCGVRVFVTAPIAIPFNR